MNRPELAHCLDTLRKGDTLVIWKLDRLGRSLRDLIEIVARLESGGIQFVSLTERHQHEDGQRETHLPRLRGTCRVRAQSNPRTHDGRPSDRPGSRTARGR
jgi:hypothetical protein